MPKNYTVLEASINPHSSDYYYDLESTDPTTTDYSAPNVELWLYEEGCWVNNVRNCTAMCSNPSLIWAAAPDGKFNVNVTANVGNCATYVILSNVLDHPEDKITSGQGTVSAYAIQSARQVEHLQINASISSCLSNFCSVKSNNCGDASDGTPQFPTFPLGSENIVSVHLHMSPAFYILTQ